jgi:hypothetical protein
MAVLLFVSVFVVLPNPSISNQADVTLSLDQNFPNPFTGSTTISYTLPEPGHVSINLYNLLGEQMQNLVELDQGTGQHSFRFDAGNLPSGQYTYRMIFTGSISVTKISRKMYLIK